MTENKRCSVMLTPDLEQAIKELRKTESCCMMSISEIIRMLVNKGLEQMPEAEVQA